MFATTLWFRDLLDNAESEATSWPLPAARMDIETAPTWERFRSSRKYSSTALARVLLMTGDIDGDVEPSLYPVRTTLVSPSCLILLARSAT